MSTERFPDGFLRVFHRALAVTGWERRTATTWRRGDGETGPGYAEEVRLRRERAAVGSDTWLLHAEYAGHVVEPVPGYPGRWRRGHRRALARPLVYLHEAKGGEVAGWVIQTADAYLAAAAWVVGEILPRVAALTLPPPWEAGSDYGWNRFWTCGPPEGHLAAATLHVGGLDAPGLTLRARATSGRFGEREWPLPVGAGTPALDAALAEVLALLAAVLADP